jgi:hypothetical protein
MNWENGKTDLLDIGITNPPVWKEYYGVDERRLGCKTAKPNRFKSYP